MKKDSFISARLIAIILLSSMSCAQSTDTSFSSNSTADTTERTAATCTTKLAMVQDMYVDHNHYKASLGIVLGTYILNLMQTIVTAAGN